MTLKIRDVSYIRLLHAREIVSNNYTKIKKMENLSTSPYHSNSFDYDLQTLPSDTLKEIFKLTDLSTLHRLNQVSKSLKNLSQDQEVIKKCLYNRTINSQKLAFYFEEILEEENLKNEYENFPAIKILEIFKQIHSLAPEKTLAPEKNLFNHLRILRIPQTIGKVNLSLLSIGHLLRKSYPHNPKGFCEEILTNPLLNHYSSFPLENLGEKLLKNEIEKPYWLIAFKRKLPLFISKEKLENYRKMGFDIQLPTLIESALNYFVNMQEGIPLSTTPCKEKLTNGESISMTYAENLKGSDNLPIRGHGIVFLTSNDYPSNFVEMIPVIQIPDFPLTANLTFLSKST